MVYITNQNLASVHCTVVADTLKKVCRSFKSEYAHFTTVSIQILEA